MENVTGLVEAGMGNSGGGIGFDPRARRSRLQRCGVAGGATGGDTLGHRALNTRNECGFRRSENTRC
jgi:hypothetical protein